MEGCNVYDDPSSSQVLDSIWAPDSSPSFHASASMVNFEGALGDHASQRQFVEHLDGKVETHGDEFFPHQPDKKRRLMPNQVRFLEKSFEVENKLEPDRKFQLAKELGLQPRQVAIWFQNRRARCKTKVLEKEYDSLKASFDKLKEDYDSLFADNEKLKTEVHQLARKLVPGENGKKPKLEPCDPVVSNDGLETRENKQDDAASSAKSDVFDSDSPLHDPSDLSQDEEDESLMRRTLLHFPKIEVESYEDLQPNSSNLGFPVQDQGTWFWQY